MRIVAIIFALSTLSLIAPATAQEIRLGGALVTLIEQTEIPARDAGVLTEMNVREGDVVSKLAPLAKVDDIDARLQLHRAQAEATIADSLAKNDVKVRFAKKQSEVADAELRRAHESIERFNRSISQTELDKLKLEAERCVLAVEEAEHEQAVAKQTSALKRTEVAAAQQVVDRRRIEAPLEGVVVQIHRRLGEWVKPGDPVVRVMRIDRLRVEAFLAADMATVNWAGRDVRLEVEGAGNAATTYPGKLTFVSPEIDPVNGQIRVWAEIENHDRRLRPGRRGTLVVAGK